MSSHVQDRYEPAIRPARMQFATSPALVFLAGPAVDAKFLELFLINFSSLGVALTDPVEDWIKRAAQRCEQVGQPELARALHAHSKAEAGHQLMMIEDTHKLAAKWNAHRKPHLDANRLLARPAPPGGRMYQKLHEDTIAGDTPFAQIAIEYEIEQLPVQFGPPLLEKCRGLLGEAALANLSFLQEHIVLDVGHTKFNEQHLDRLLQRNPEFLPALVSAGAAALEAYATFLHDCVEITRRQVAEFA